MAAETITQADAPAPGTETTAKPTSMMTDTKPSEQKPPATTETVKPAGGEQKPGEQKPPAEFKLTGDYDAEVVGALAAAAQKHNVSQEAAQAILNAAGEKFAERAQAMAAAQSEEWRDAISNHAEFGKDKLKDSLSVVGKLLNKFGNDGLRDWLDTSGVGNNPHLFELLVRVGKRMAPDTFVDGRPPVEEASTAKTMFPNMN